MTKVNKEANSLMLMWLDRYMQLEMEGWTDWSKVGIRTTTNEERQTNARQRTKGMDKDEY